MSTATSTSFSTLSDTGNAVRSAWASARAQLPAAPVLVVAFAGPDRDLDVVHRELTALAPGATVLGCHTAGEFTERGLEHGSVALMLVSSDELLVGGALGTGARTDAAALAATLAQPWKALLAEATRRGLSAASSILLVDGLAGSGDRVVKAYQANTRVVQQIVGGAAGDEGRFVSTGVFGPQGATADGAAAVQVFGRKPLAVGTGHGLAPASRRMRVTKARDSTLYELDGRPAFEAWREHAESRGVTLTEANRGRYLITNELGVFFLDSLHHARAPVGVNEDGSVKLVADLAEGASVCILDGDPDAMVAACGAAAREARQALGASAAAGVLVFDCVCRGMILGDDFAREIDAVRAEFPSVPVLGFLTYGEIARSGGRLDGWHNTTSVVVAIPA
ncbi:MAG: FIST C-terminal domain-containing protein [Myxococcaceae bacterium]|jgi:methyl-accepting chemotaxis protein|nr:FIST C-terminal domain-containing protein [Myxococcaceae bacterium]